MRTYTSLIFMSALALLGSACSQQAAKTEPAVPVAEYRATATIKEIMDSLVDPGSDFIWESVATTVSAKGVEEKAPHTDEEWKEVRRHAIQLMEATNLLIMPGRHVAKPGEKADDPKVELGPEQIEALINSDRKSFNDFAHGLYDTIPPVIDAIDKKDPEALLNAGDAIDRACENCHLKYWYPNEAQGQAQARPPADGKPTK